MKTKLEQILVLGVFVTFGGYIYLTQKEKVKRDLAKIEQVKKTETKLVEEPLVPVITEQKAETPKPAPIPVPEKPKEETLPAGEYVVTERVSLVTDSGIKAFSAGERVKQVEGGYTNGKITLPVPPNKLTNLKSLANRLVAEKSERERVAPVVAATPVEEEKPLANSPAQIPNAFEDPRVLAIQSQIDALQNRINELQQKDSSRINANGPTITRLKIQIAELERKKNELKK